MVPRNQNVDAFRVIAVLAVITLHAAPFENPTVPLGQTIDVATVLNQLARFAVPYFFVISGYFFGLKADGGQEAINGLIRIFKRLVPLLLIWSAIYVIPFNFSSQHLPAASGLRAAGDLMDPLQLQRKLLTGLFQGTKVHLWFVISLLWCAGIATLFLVHGKLRWLVAFSVTLYALGLLAKAYSATPLGLTTSFNTRNGPFFGLVFFTTGYLLSRTKPDRSWFRKGILLLMLGVLAHFSEIVVLNAWFDVSMLQDYVVGTYLLGLGTGLIALSGREIPGAATIGKYGKYVLGIYLCHFAFIDLLRGGGLPNESLVWQVIHVPLVFFLSLMLVVIANRFGVGRKIMGIA